MKILQLCNKPPYPPVDGGTLAMNSITQGLMAAGHEVRVLALHSDKHPALRDRMDEEYLRRTRFESVYVDLKPHLLDALVCVLCGESYHVKRFVSADFAARLREVLEEEEFDVVHVESIFLTPYVPLIRKHSRAKVVLRAHNVEHQIWRRTAQGESNPWRRWYLKNLALTLGVYEREHVNDYDGVVCITEQDAQGFREMGCRRKPLTVPFGIDMAGYSAEAPAEEPYSLYHLGAMDWMPNQEGVRWLTGEVWPLIRERLPQARLYLAGRRMPEEFLSMKTEGVTVVGEVDDAREFAASKQVCVVPLKSGGGMRVKIVEAMAQGKAIVSTAVGAEGIACTAGANLLIADSPEAFAEQVCRCLEEEELRSRLGRSARRLAEEEYDNQRLIGRLTEFYQQ